MQEKTCTCCLVVKSITEYNKHAGRRDGYQNLCRTCEKQKSRAAYQADPSKMLERVKRYRDEDPEKNRRNSANYRARNVERWSKENPDRLGTKTCIVCKSEKPKSEFYPNKYKGDGLDQQCNPCRNAISKRTRDANPEYYRAKAKDYWARNAPLKSRLRKSYEMAKLQRDFTHWDQELSDLIWEELFRKKQWLNEHTGVTWSVDHVIPLRGELVSGLHVWNNWALLTHAANSGKRNRFDPI
jgi:hypothetical protein